MRAGLLVFTLLASLFQLAAQEPSTEQPPTVFGVLREMKSSNQAERERAFNKASELLASYKTTARDLDRLRVGVIQLLITENAINDISDEEQQKQVPSQPSCGDGTDNCEGDEEDQSDYLPRLSAAVAAFHEERAIPALVGAMPWGGAVTTALLGFGDKAIGPVTEQLKSRNSSLRMSALDVSISLLQARSDLASRTRLSGLIESSLADVRPVVRSHAVEQIVCLYNRQDYLPTLEKIAKTDPWKLPGRVFDGGDGGQFYPVRYQARRALRAIQNTKGCL